MFAKIIQQQDEHANTIKNQAVSNKERESEESRISENAQQSLVEDNGNEVVERDESIAIEVDVPEPGSIVNIETPSSVI